VRIRSTVYFIPDVRFEVIVEKTVKNIVTCSGTRDAVRIVTLFYLRLH
jgi:hypothetical protein